MQQEQAGGYALNALHVDGTAACDSEIGWERRLKFEINALQLSRNLILTCLRRVEQDIAR
jgi:hypothetical protein